MKETSIVITGLISTHVFRTSFIKQKGPPFVHTPYSMLFVFKYNFLSVEVQNQWLLCRREPDVV